MNALLGARVLEEGVTPTTSRVGILEHGEEVTRRARPDGVEETTAPAAILKTVAIVDTPGTNAVLREHEALTRDFLPRADLVLFVTSADRPYAESERAFVEAIREWGKKVVLVLNKADVLESGEDVAKVVAFVRDEAARTLGAPPEVFPLSARDAQRARERGDAALLERSGLPAFEAKVTATLDERERFRLKLQSPLGVARRAHREAADVVARRLAVLGGDVLALDAIETRVPASRRSSPATSASVSRTSRRPSSSSRGGATPSSTSGCIYGMGICEMVGPLQDMATKFHRCSVDNALLANTRGYIVKRDSGLDKPFKIYPGFRLPVDDPKSDVVPIQLGDIYQSTLTERQNIFGLAEKRTGVSDYLTGRESPIIGSRATATSTLALIQEGTKRVEEVLENIREGFAEIALNCFWIWIQYGTDGLEDVVFESDEVANQVKDFLDQFHEKHHRCALD